MTLPTPHAELVKRLEKAKTEGYDRAAWCLECGCLTTYGKSLPRALQRYGGTGCTAQISSGSIDDCIAALKARAEVKP